MMLMVALDSAYFLGSSVAAELCSVRETQIKGLLSICTQSRGEFHSKEYTWNVTIEKVLAGVPDTNCFHCQQL